MKKIKNNLLLLLTALIWGGAFVAQSTSMDYIGPWTFTCIRCLLAGIALIVALPLISKITNTSSNSNNVDTLKGGLACGFILAPATLFQQIGILYTTVGKAGFITALYCIIVPFLSIFLKKKVSLQTWIAAIISLTGFYFLSLSNGIESISIGDIYLLLSSFFFAIHILVVDYFSPKANGIKMSAIQFITVGVLTFIPMLIIEKPQIFRIKQAIIPILYAGLLSNSLGYTFQIIGQRGADPTVATLILSLESVFSAIGGFLLLHEVLTTKELLGCLLVFIGVILAQIKINGRDF